jgi:hypothetical protein
MSATYHQQVSPQVFNRFADAIRHTPEFQFEFRGRLQTG